MQTRAIFCDLFSPRVIKAEFSVYYTDFKSLAHNEQSRSLIIIGETAINLGETSTWMQSDFLSEDPPQCKWMQNAHAAAGRFDCMSILWNRFVLSVNPALCVVCYFFGGQGEAPFSTWQRNSLSFPPRGHRSGILRCVCGVASLQHGRVCSDVLTRMRPTSKLMHKLSVHISGFSWNTPNPQPTWAKREKKKKHGEAINARAATYSWTAWISALHLTPILDTVHIVVFSRCFRSADITNKQARWSLTRCFPHFICREESQPSMWNLLCNNRKTWKRTVKLHISNKS